MLRVLHETVRRTGDKEQDDEEQEEARDSESVRGQ